MHIALLGDSTFDNAAYTEGGPDVVTHLNRLLVGSDTATLLAVDGAMIGDVDAQLARLEPLLDPRDPGRVTHVALSVGGNDLLAEIDVLGAPAEHVAEALLAVRDRARAFGVRYRRMLGEVIATVDRAVAEPRVGATRRQLTATGTGPSSGRHPTPDAASTDRRHPIPDAGPTDRQRSAPDAVRLPPPTQEPPHADAPRPPRLPLVLATVYNGAFEGERQAGAIETALRVFDHEIVEAGLDLGLPVIDLRRVCSEPADYWNPIEPGERGGAKIAAAVLGAVRAVRHDLGGPAVTLQGTGA